MSNKCGRINEGPLYTRIIPIGYKNGELARLADRESGIVAFLSHTFEDSEVLLV